MASTAGPERRQLEYSETWPRWRGSVATLGDLALTIEEIVTDRTGDDRSPTVLVWWDESAAHRYPVAELKDRLDERRLRRAHHIDIVARTEKQLARVCLSPKSEPGARLELARDDEQTWARLRAVVASGVPWPPDTSEVMVSTLASLFVFIGAVAFLAGDAVGPSWLGFALASVAVFIAMNTARVAAEPVFRRLFPPVELLSSDQLARASLLRWAVPPLPALVGVAGLVLKYVG
jgi:hypothetical protein